MIGHEFRRAELAVRKFGVLVDVAPPLDDLGFNFFGASIDPGGQRILNALGGYRNGSEPDEGQDNGANEPALKTQSHWECSWSV